MKLASLYTPSAHKKRNNSLYEYFQSYFIEGLKEPEEREPVKESIEFERYIYRLSEKEIDFYENHYIPQGKKLLVGDDSFLRKNFNKLDKDFVVGENARDLIVFVQELSDNLGLLISPIGWGKTALIRYVWFYLIGKSDILERSTIPVYISIDHYKGLFQGLKSTSQIRNIFVNEILRERLIDVVRPFTELDDEAFWEYLKKGTDKFNSLEQYEIDMLKIYGKSAENSEKIFNARMQARKDEDFYYTSLKYIREKLNKLPVLLLDNVDTLSLTTNDVILDEALRLTKLFKIKVLISMRNTTYSKIASRKDGTIRAYPPLRIELEKLDIKDYLKHKTLAIKQNVKTASQRYEYINYKGSARVTFKNATSVYDAMLSVLLSAESSNVLAHVTYFNLRKINSLLLKYLATGYIDDHKLIQKILEGKLTDDEYNESPLWILISSVITNNHVTRFSEQGISYQEGVLNLYCNGTNRLNSHLIRLHILNLIKRVGETTVYSLIEAYRIFFPDAKEVKTNILYAIWRLISFDLIESPEHYKVDSFDDIENIKTISLTSTGDYYRQEFINYYEYLVYMKDDVDFEENNFNIQDCIQVSSLAGRYNEVFKFLTFLFEKEVEFLRNLNLEQRLHYTNFFSPPENLSPFITCCPVKNMIEFGEKRSELLQDGVLRFKGLMEEIEKNGKVFKEAYGG